MPNTRPDNLTEFWEKRRARSAAAVAAGQCKIYKAQSGEKIHVASPYDAQFVAGARTLRGARWLPKEKAWTFHPAAHAAVVSLCRRVYGWGKVVGFLPKNEEE